MNGRCSEYIRNLEDSDTVPTTVLMNSFRLILLCWMLSIHILSCVVCRSHSTGISVEDGNDSVDISKSVHRLTAPQRNGQEHQLEKSISSHDQDETWNSIRKRHYQHTNPQPTKKAKMKRKQRQFDNIRQSAHDFNVFQLDYVDFGAVIGQNGAFSWHANYSPD